MTRAKTKPARIEISNLGHLIPRASTESLILTVLRAIAGFEREMMLERQRVGIARAKAEGRVVEKAARRPRGRRLGRSAGSRRRGWAGLGSRCGWRRGAVDLSVAGERLVVGT